MGVRWIDIARIYGDPDDDYDSFEKCVVRSIDALDILVGHLDDFIFDANLGSIEISEEGQKDLKSQRAVCISLRDTLREWGLGIPHHEVAK
jgi:hypothetical protein